MPPACLFLARGRGTFQQHFAGWQPPITGKIAPMPQVAEWRLRRWKRRMARRSAAISPQQRFSRSDCRAERDDFSSRDMVIAKMIISARYSPRCDSSKSTRGFTISRCYLTTIDDIMPRQNYVFGLSGLLRFTTFNIYTGTCRASEHRRELRMAAAFREQRLPHFASTFRHARMMRAPATKQSGHVFG